MTHSRKLVFPALAPALGHCRLEPSRPTTARLHHSPSITRPTSPTSMRSAATTAPPSSKVTPHHGRRPLLEPANGPTHLFPFDPDLLLRDQDRQQQRRARGRDVPVPLQRPSSSSRNVYTAAARFQDGAVPVSGGPLVVPPRITTFDNPGLNLRQTYTVTMIRGSQSTTLRNEDGSPFFAVPGNVGPRTMDYQALFNLATYRLGNGFSVFRGHHRRRVLDRPGRGLRHRELPHPGQRREPACSRRPEDA